jgi:hypothetical protein
MVEVEYNSRHADRLWTYRIGDVFLPRFDTNYSSTNNWWYKAGVSALDGDEIIASPNTQDSLEWTEDQQRWTRLSTIRSTNNR